MCVQIHMFLQQTFHSNLKDCSGLLYPLLFALSQDALQAKSKIFVPVTKADQAE